MCTRRVRFPIGAEFLKKKRIRIFIILHIYANNHAVKTTRPQVQTIFFGHFFSPSFVRIVLQKNKLVTENYKKKKLKTYVTQLPT